MPGVTPARRAIHLQRTTPHSSPLYKIFKMTRKPVWIGENSCMCKVKEIRRTTSMGQTPGRKT